MSHITTQRWRRARTISLAISATLALGLTGTTIAFASPGDIDTSNSGSLTIHKQVEGSQTVPGTVDNAIGTGNGTPIAEVEFTIWPIASSSVNLATSAGWAQLNNFVVPGTACPATSSGTPTLTVPAPAAGDPAISATFGTKETLITSASGIASFADLPVAAYLVCETDAPANVLTTAAPFVVTVPTLSTDSNSWVYDVNVFPKNELTEDLVKTINVDSVVGNVGQAQYSITATIPALDQGEGFSYFMVRDPLSASLNYSAAITGNTPVEVRDSLGALVAIDASEYTVTGAAQNDILVRFTTTGLEKLAENTGGTVTVTIGTTVTSGINTFSNTAQFFVQKFTGDRPTPPVDPPTDPQESTKVVSTTGDLTITKTSSSSMANTLAGAEFVLYPAAAPFAATANDCAVTTPQNPTAISIGAGRQITRATVGGPDITNPTAIQTITTGATGTATVTGLYIDSTGSIPVEDTTTVPTNNFRCYVLVETKAPLGYTLNTAPIAVAVAYNPGTPTAITVENTPSNLPDLPLTGAAGQLLMVGAGAALIALAFGSVVLIRQRQKLTKK